jgi:hypothetical protein
MTFLRTSSRSGVFLERYLFGKPIAVFQVTLQAQQANRRAAVVSPNKRRKEFAAQSSSIHYGGHC